jgi:branched-chain amino acid transport system ATP-binding protein
MTTPVLAARSLSVRYGGVHALTDVDLEVGPGELVGLIGPNGAGKTTLIDALTGFTPHDGRVELGGVDMTGLRPHARARRGLTRTWQAVELFADLTVAENLEVSAYVPSVKTAVRELFVNGDRTAPQVAEMLARVGIEDLADTMPGDLSEGQRKLVGVARAYAAHPKVLCLDEPAAGLDTAESLELGRRLRAFADEGMPMLLVDHDMRLVLGISDRVIVLEFGQVIAAGRPDEIRRDPRVISAYLGTSTSPDDDGSDRGEK